MTISIILILCKAFFLYNAILAVSYYGYYIKNAHLKEWKTTVAALVLVYGLVELIIAIVLFLMQIN